MPREAGYMPLIDTSHPAQGKYVLQKIALEPFLHETAPECLFNSLQSLSFKEKKRLASIIETSSLGPMWLEVVGRESIGKIWTEEWLEKLHKQNRGIGFLYIGQFKTMRIVSRTLDNNAIAHAFFKGAHTRETVYKNPAARYSCDIDLLIAEEDKTRVIEILIGEGFAYNAIPENHSHEASLVKKGINLDLHWHILRPGRIPKSLTTELLENRINNNGYWALGNEENMFILLIHPILTKYLYITHSSLILFLDLVLWLRQPINWDEVYSLLAKTGLRSAAWIILEYLRLFTGITAPQSFTQNLAPHPLKQLYLRQWIQRDLAGRLRKTPFITKLFFTLFAHDSLRDVSVFLKTLLADRRLNKF